MENILNETVHLYQPNSSDFADGTDRTVLTCILFIVDMLIISVNMFVVVCLIVNIKPLSNNFVNIQILSFSITDMIVGITAIPVVLSFKITASFPYYEVCAAVMFLYCCAQAANLVHTFVICVHRLIIIKRWAFCNETHPKKVGKTILIQILFIWFVSGLICSVPFFIYGRSGYIIRECSLNNLFGENYVFAVTIVDVIVVSLQIFVNALYIYLYRFISNTWKLIQPSHSFNNIPSTLNAEHSMHWAISRKHDDYAPKVKLNKSAMATSSFQTATKVSKAQPALNSCRKMNLSMPNLEIYNTDFNDDNGEIYNSVKRNNNDLIQNTNISGIPGSPIAHRITNNSVDLGDSACHRLEGKGKLIALQMDLVESRKNILSRTVLTQLPSKFQRSRSVPTHLNKIVRKCDYGSITEKHETKENNRRKGHTGFKGQREVLITIGIILLVLNICITPINVIFLIELSTDYSLSRDVKFVFMAMALLNSALDPFIYALRIKQFKESLRKTFIKCSKPFSRFH